jgi:hypothetical protein
MPATETKAPRVTWKQGDVLTLADAYRAGGINGAQNAFPDTPRAAIEAKLESLGLLELSETDDFAIEQLLIHVREGAAGHPALFVRHAIAALRKAVKQ